MALHSSHGTTLLIPLVDGCPRCEQHAQHPFDSLDDAHLRQLTERVLAWMSYKSDSSPRSNNERLAMRQIEDVIRKYRRLVRAGFDPRRLAQK
jgi:hypothetical protein